MKVLLINGSPRKDGCTNRALEEVAKSLNAEGIETEIFQVGNKSITGCINCGYCHKNNKENGCYIKDDGVNLAIEKLKSCDGLIIGSPVYYASPNGTLISFLDRLFYASKDFRFKVGASIVSCRRSGSTSSLEVLNKYFTIYEMPIASSTYWPMVHGSTKEDVEKDLEGLQVMRQLGRNMAFMIKAFKCAKENGIDLPSTELKKERTNFIR